jgi:hypothetical protein
MVCDSANGNRIGSACDHCEMSTAGLPGSPSGTTAAAGPIVSGPPRWWEAVRILLALWAVTLVVCAAGLAFAGVMGDLGCEKPPGSSQYGTLGVSAVPVGLECRYGTVGLPDVDRPGATALAIQLALAVVPLGAWVMARELPDNLQSRARREILLLAVFTGALCGAGFAVAGLLETGPQRVLPPFAVAAAIVTAGLVAALGLVVRPRPGASSDWP